MTALRANGLARHFGRHAVFAGLALELEPCEKVALLGPNGSGKTTLLRVLAGTLRPTAGHVDAPSTMYVPQDAPVYPELTAAEHLRFACRLHGATPDPAALGPLAEVPGGALSRGQRQRLHLEMALQSGADVLLLDEPFTALDAAGKEWLEAEFTGHPAAALMSLHDDALATRLCDRSVHLEVR